MVSTLLINVGSLTGLPALGRAVGCGQATLALNALEASPIPRRRCRSQRRAANDAEMPPVMSGLPGVRSPLEE